MPSYYSNNFGAIIRPLMQGKTHSLFFGDSQHAESRVNTPTGTDLFMRMIVPNLRPHYLVGPGTSATLSQTAFFTPGFTATGLTFTSSYGNTVTDVNYGAGTPTLGRAGASLLATLDFADNTDLGAGNGQALQMMRQASANGPTPSNRSYSWPLNNGSNRPWFHGEHVKSRMIVQGRASGGWNQIDIATRRVGLSANNSSAFVTCTIAATETIQATSWTAALADAGNYQTTASGLLNDHYVQCTARTTAGYNENGLTLLIPAWQVARCDSGGVIPWNADNTGLGMDFFGRSGASCADWASNYWSQAQWQQYFAATVLVPNAHVTVGIMLGHNVNGAGEQSGNLVTATWSTNYQTIITRIRNAFAAAFPSGTLNLLLIVPWRCTEESNFMNSTASCDSLQAAVEALAAANGAAWFSYYMYYNKAAAIPDLHPDSQFQGETLARAFRDAIDRSTNYAFTTHGGVGGSTGPRRNF
jgi:hypothetical protein